MIALLSDFLKQYRIHTHDIYIQIILQLTAMARDTQTHIIRLVLARCTNTNTLRLDLKSVAVDIRLLI